MNDFGARKLGEVIAFLRLTTDTYSRSKTALLTVIEQAEYDDLVGQLADSEAGLLEIAKESDKGDATSSKAASTFEKLSKMRDLYIGDEWENPTEVYEWQSFASGAGIAHASLMMGVAQAMDDDHLAVQIETAHNLFADMLEGIQHHLHDLGETRAKE